jgi:hypothetical protein
MQVVAVKGGAESERVTEEEEETMRSMFAVPECTLTSLLLYKTAIDRVVEQDRKCLREPVVEEQTQKLKKEEEKNQTELSSLLSEEGLMGIGQEEEGAAVESSSAGGSEEWGAAEIKSSNVAGIHTIPGQTCYAYSSLITVLATGDEEDRVVLHMFLPNGDLPRNTHHLLVKMATM